MTQRLAGRCFHYNGTPGSKDMYTPKIYHNPAPNDLDLFDPSGEVFGLCPLNGVPTTAVLVSEEYSLLVSA